MRLNELTKALLGEGRTPREHLEQDAAQRIDVGPMIFDWTSEKSTRTVKFLLRMPGYRGQELSVSADGDTKQRVVLDKLGPDDIDDVQNCKPR
ncbi:MAG: hypothetical protein JWM82_1806 [Myxococcales bacterium]|nr:hypothetical protein [Myxococcales bacterium]